MFIFNISTLLYGECTYSHPLDSKLELSKTNLMVIFVTISFVKIIITLIIELSVVVGHI